MQQPITIAGGGIGGLTAAAAMARAGLDVQVYEAAPSYAHVGGGHWLYGNALMTLDQIDPGLVDDLRALGHPLQGFRFTTNTGRKIIHKSVRPFVISERYAPLVLHRADIIKVLAARVPAGRLHFDKRIATAHPDRLEFEDGTSTPHSLLIGADGIHSRVRSLVAPHVKPNNSGQVGIWGLSEGTLPPEHDSLFVEMWGNGQRVGYTKVGRDKVYWFVVLQQQALPAAIPDLKEFVLSRIGAFPAAVAEVVAASAPHTIQLNPLFDLPIVKQWHRGAVCCLGDAIHACTPNLGQGGCQAIEDGFWLAHYLANSTSHEAAFTAFQQQRQARARAVVLLSRWLGQLAQSQGSVGTAWRNTSARLHPRWPVNKVLQWIMLREARDFPGVLGG